MSSTTYCGALGSTQNIEAYFEEIGRAGRVGAPAVATLPYRAGHLNDKLCCSSVVHCN